MKLSFPLPTIKTLKLQACGKPLSSRFWTTALFFALVPIFAQCLAKDISRSFHSLDSTTLNESGGVVVDSTVEWRQRENAIVSETPINGYQPVQFVAPTQEDLPPAVEALNGQANVQPGTIISGLLLASLVVYWFWGNG